MQAVEFTSILNALDNHSIKIQDTPEEPKVNAAPTDENYSERYRRATAYVDKIPGEAEGGRNAAAYGIAARLREKFDLTQDDTANLLAGWNSKNTPPLGAAELSGTVESAYKYAKKPAGSGYEPATKADMTYHLTDAGNGQRFADQFGSEYRYDWTAKQWLRWDGKKWNREEALQKARTAAVQCARAISREAEKIDDKDRREAIYKHAIRSESASSIAAMLQMAQAVEPIPTYTRLLDPDGMLFNCRNGYIDLTTGKAYPHDPAKLMTKISPVEYLPGARDSRWDQFLEFITEGDQAFQEFLQRAVGYSLTGDVREEVFLMIHGPRATGKSTFCEAIKHVLGGYASVADFGIFLKTDKTGPRNDIARLHGQRFVVSSEVDDGKSLAEGLIKNLSGNDTISARFLYQESFEFIPTFKLWLSCNDAPRISDADGAMWRRVLRLPFENQLPDNRRDPTVKSLMKSAAMGSVILAWAVEGCLKWQQDGLCIPPRVIEAVEEYREENDPLKDFMDLLKFDPAFTVSVGELRTAYDTFCHEIGQRYPISPREFNKRLEAKNCYRKTTRYAGRDQKCWRGVGFKTAFSV